jgi:DNA modification methylase
MIDLRLGDCLKVMETLKDKSIDTFFTQFFK